MTQSLSPVCRGCGEPVPEGAGYGLCPRCVFAQAALTETVSGAAPPAAPSMESVQTAFPHLEICSLIGSGGMGAVFKARQPQLDRFVALKILPEEYAARPGFAERFQSEAKTLARLNHPHIVTIHDFGCAAAGAEAGRAGFYFLLMEFVDGVNLRQLLKAKRLSPAEALSIVPPVCAALQCAHERGIVHRDIKPENILIDKAGTVKIADFGIARLLETRPGASANELPPQAAPAFTPLACGTPAYCAPEQVKGAADHRADIYSLGVVLYEMLTGERPKEKIEAPSKRVQVDIRIDEIVLRALEKEPELRFATADEFRTQVEGIRFQPAKRPRAKWAAAALALAVVTLALTLGSVIRRNNDAANKAAATGSDGSPDAHAAADAGRKEPWTPPREFDPPASTLPDAVTQYQTASREEPAAKIAQAAPADLAPRYAKWGAANAVIGAAEGWVLAYDMQQAQRRMGAARRAELRVFPDGRVLAYSHPQVAKPAEMRLAPDELKALLDEVEKDPKTREHKFETPLGDLDAQSQQVALTGLLAASTPLGWDIGGDVVVVRRGNRVFVRSFDGIKEPLFERLHYHWIRRTLAGGTEGISKALNFANEQLLARHPTAPKLEPADFLSASFTAHPVDTRIVHFRSTGAGGAFCQITVYEPAGGPGYVLHDATFRPAGGAEDIWGQRHR